mgnify:CR=1 FL=1
MGVDRGIHVTMSDAEYEGLPPLAVAKLFAKIVEQEKPGLVILGKQVCAHTVPVFFIFVTKLNVVMSILAISFRATVATS